MNRRLKAEAKNLRGQRRCGSRPCRGRQAGFTLIELMIAISVLAIGMSAAIILVLMGMQNDSRSKTDTTATVLDQEIIELYSTLKMYPRPTFVNINDCATAASVHQAALGQGPSPTGNGATLYTAASAPTAAQVGDIDWTQPVPVLATATQTGYAMEYQTCDGNTYEVRWNVMNLTPGAPPVGSTGRLSLLTVSARPRSAVGARGSNQAILYAPPVTLRSMIED